MGLFSTSAALGVYVGLRAISFEKVPDPKVDQTTDE